MKRTLLILSFLMLLPLSASEFISMLDKTINLGLKICVVGTLLYGARSLLHKPTVAIEEQKKLYQAQQEQNQNYIRINTNMFEKMSQLVQEKTKALKLQAEDNKNKQAEQNGQVISAVTQSHDSLITVLTTLKEQLDDEAKTRQDELIDFLKKQAIEGKETKDILLNIQTNMQQMLNTPQNFEQILVLLNDIRAKLPDQSIQAAPEAQ